MTEPQILPNSPPGDALSRFLAVSNVLCRERNGESRPEAIAHTLSVQYPQFAPHKNVCERTLYRWIAAFEKNGFQGLVSAQRAKIEDSLVISKSLLEYFSSQKKADPCVSIPELIKRAIEQNMVPPDVKLSRVTVWRSLNRMGVDTRRRKKPKDKFGRRFAYPHRMNMVLCDGKHFRAGVGRHKRVALFFLDDATRKGLNVVVGTSENAALFLRGLFETIQRYGLMGAFFVDGGPGFIAEDTVAVFANLAVLLIHGTARYPEGHGKIEKFNQTALSEAIRYFPGNPEVDPDCRALELRLRHYLFERYDHSPHESLKNESPLDRFSNDPQPLRFHKDQNQLKQAFVLHETRRVSKDNVIKYDGQQFEVPFGHAGTKISVYRNVLDGTLSIIHAGHKVVLSQVDLHANARDKRPQTQKQAEPDIPLQKSSAQMAYERDFQPIIAPDGGFSPKNHKENK